MTTLIPYYPHRDLIRAGNMSEFRRAVDLGLDIRERGGDFLRIAAACGRETFVRFLVERGADVRTRDDECAREAAAGGHLEIMRYLVANGADVCAADKSCVAGAAGNLRYASVVYLTSLGADIRNINIKHIRYHFRRVLERRHVRSRCRVLDCDKTCLFDPRYLIMRGSLCGYTPSSIPQLRELKRLLVATQTGMAQAPFAARRIYFWWVPLCFGLTRRCGRRAARRNFRAFRRLGI